MASIIQSGKQVMEGREAFAKGQKEEREGLRELCNAGIEKVCNDPEQFAAYLNTMVVVPGYTSRNAMLVYQQMPEATFVESPKGWYDMGRYVPEEKKNDGINIFKPKEKQGGTYFDPKMVYDISQTVGRAVKKPAIQLAEGSGDMQKAFDALVESSPVPVVADEGINMPAVYDPGKREILVSDAFSDYDTFAAVVNATTHAGMHRDDIRASGGVDRGYDTSDFEFVTACTTYVVCKRFGVPVEGVNFEATTDVLGIMDIEGKDAMLKIIGDGARKCGDKVQDKVRPKAPGRSPRPLDHAR